MESPELSLPIIIAGGVALFVLGLIIGLLSGRRIAPGSQKYHQVERKLDQVLQDKKAYEDEVVSHFSDTAKLLNSLTESYRDVHNHLAKGADTLCQGEGPMPLDRPRSPADPAEIPPYLAETRQPLDYAPKSSPDEKGMLNEEFGLDRGKTLSGHNPAPPKNQG